MKQITGHLSCGPKARALSVRLVMHPDALPEHVFVCVCMHIHTLLYVDTQAFGHILTISVQDSAVKVL